MSRIRDVNWVGWILIALSLLALLVIPWPTSTETRAKMLERAKAATFELNVDFLFLGATTSNWKTNWEAFSKETGAQLLLELDNNQIVFKVSAGGTAWFFARSPTAYVTYALTNHHVADDKSVRKKIESAKTFASVLFSIVDSKIDFCPNFSNLDEFPGCGMSLGIDWRMWDDVLDIEVLGLTIPSTQPVTTLDIDSSGNLVPGTKVFTIGAALGVNDIVAEGKLLDTRVPYFINDMKWRWVIPYDMNSVGGFSGSPVINAQTGKVIGLHRGSILDPRGSGRSIGLFVPMEYIAKVLVVNGYPIAGVELK